MNDQTTDPNTVQITVWRNLLDAFGQLSAAWEAAGKAQRAAEAGAGPGAVAMPEPLVTSFARASQEAADTLAGVALVLSQQGEDAQRFADLARSQRRIRDEWAEARDALAKVESPPD